MAPTRTLAAAPSHTRSAASAPATCAAEYFSAEPDVILPSTQNAVVTAGFRWPPLIRPSGEYMIPPPR